MVEIVGFTKWDMGVGDEILFLEEVGLCSCSSGSSFPKTNKLYLLENVP